MAVVTEQRIRELKQVSHWPQRACDFARTAHQGQKRDDGQEDYFAHPMRVVGLVSKFTDDSGIQCAAWLHDTLEDCEGVTPEMLRDLFGLKITEVVQELTLPDTPQSISPPHRWRYKTDLLVQKAGTMSDEAKLVKICDRIDNLESAKHTWKPRRLARYAIQGFKMLEAMYPLQPMHLTAANHLLLVIGEILVQTSEHNESP